MNEKEDKNKDKVEQLLIRFIEKATSKEATTAEIEALPHVAEVLLKYLG